MAVIPFGDVVDRQLLPVDAQDIVTKVRLVIAGDMAGSQPATLWADAGTGVVNEHDHVDYAPLPIVYEWEAPEHAVYGAERSFALPSGVNPFLPPTDPLIPEPSSSFRFDNPGMPSAVRDGDPTTYAEFLGGSLDTGLIDYQSTLGVYGYRLRYELEREGTASSVQAGTTFVQAFISPIQLPPALEAFPNLLGGLATIGSVITHVRPLGGSEQPTEQYMVVPALGHWAPENNPVNPLTGYAWGKVTFFAGFSITRLRVYAFYPLILNEPLLEDIARAQIRLPGVLPQRITVRGVIPPDREHTITGWPGGDYTGVVAQHQYELGRTVIDFEQAGSPVGLPAEAMEAARERRQAIGDTIAVANYNLMMGSRR